MSKEKLRQNILELLPCAQFEAAEVLGVPLHLLTGVFNSMEKDGIIEKTLERKPTGNGFATAAVYALKRDVDFALFKNDLIFDKPSLETETMNENKFKKECRWVGEMEISFEEALFIKENLFNRSNRNLAQAKVKQYAEEMRNSRWRVTNQGISFAKDGTLLDGVAREALLLSLFLLCFPPPY